MKPIQFHPDAAEEVRAAAARYCDIRPTLADDFREELATTLTRIRENPFLYAAETGDIRVASVHRFPYVVIYEDLTDQIWVAAVAHHGRRPGYWSGRRPD